jgi:regulator of sigma E protease
LEIKPVNLEHGLSVHPYLEKYHLSSGDKVLTIEGQEVLNLDELNKGIMFRGARKLTVLHPNGETEKIALPKEIDRTLFQVGALPAFGLRSNANMVGEVIKDSPAKKAGLRKNDVLIAVNSDTVQYFDQLTRGLYYSKGKKCVLTVLRGNDTLKLKTSVKVDGTIGFLPSGKILVDSSAIQEKHYGLGESISIGMTYGKNTLSDYIAQFKFVFTKKGATSIGGFAAIGNMFPPVWDWQSFWMSTALLSIILAFMNILPIPALDGGHVVFLLYEMITGKEAPQKVLEYAQMIGIVLLLTLMVYANGNDLIRWITSF